MKMFVRTVLLSMKRRKKEIRFVSLAVFIAVLFMSAVGLFQNTMNQYRMETNYSNYGEWILSAVDRKLEHPYFSGSGSCNTGAVLLDEEGSQTRQYLGSLGETFWELSHLSFYEGRMPETANEIAMTLPALAELGYSYDLGQTIRVTALMEENCIEQEFTLVGTMKNFSETWSSATGFPLPSCIVTEEALNDIGGSAYTTHFYQLDRQYEDVNTQQFAAPFVQQISEQFPITYNSYTYENRIWGSPEMLRNIQGILIVIAVLVISYLMMSYVTKRRKWYYQMRCSGTERTQIWLMIFMEGMYGTVPWAIAALIIPYIAGTAGCYIVAKQMEIPYFFKADAQVFVWQVLAVFGVIGISIVAACLSSSDKRLGSNVHEVTKRQLKRLRRASGKSENAAKNFYKRQNKLQPFQRMAMLLISIVVCSLLGLCMHQISKEYRAYRLTMDTYHDFSAEKIIEIMYEYVGVWENENGEWEEYVWGSGAGGQLMYVGMSSQMEAELANIEGLEQIYKSSHDSEYEIDWEGSENSPIFQYFEKRNKEEGVLEGNLRTTEIVTNTYIYEEFEQALKYHKGLIESAQIDAEAFRTGEQILVLLFKGEFMNSAEELWETTLQTGDMVTMSNSQFPGQASAEAVVLTLSEEEIYQHAAIPVKYFQPYTVIASRTFAERVAESAGETFQYNTIDINYDQNASFDSTTKMLARLFEENGFQYGSSWEMKRVAKETFIQSLCAYGVLFCIVLAVYLILLLNLNQMKGHERARKYQILKRLGMSDSFFLKLTTKGAVKDALWLVVGIPISYGLFFVMEWITFAKETTGTQEWSSFTGAYTVEAFEIVMGNLMDNTNISYIVIFVVMLIAATTGMTYLSEKKSIKGQS